MQATGGVRAGAGRASEQHPSSGELGNQLTAAKRQVRWSAVRRLRRQRLRRAQQGAAATRPPHAPAAAAAAANMHSPAENEMEPCLCHRCPPSALAARTQQGRRHAGMRLPMAPPAHALQPYARTYSHTHAHEHTHTHTRTHTHARTHTHTHTRARARGPPTSSASSRSRSSISGTSSSSPPPAAAGAPARRARQCRGAGASRASALSTVSGSRRMMAGLTRPPAAPAGRRPRLHPAGSPGRRGACREPR